MSENRIVFISGKAGSGKTTFANHLIAEGYDIVILSFAKLLKQCALPLINVFLNTQLTLEDLDDGDVKKKILPGVGDGKFTVRNILQFLGTEFGKDILDQNVWVKAVHKQIYGTTDMSDLSKGIVLKNKYIIIADARFEDELGYGKSIGAHIIHISRTHLEIESTHRSETSIGKSKLYNSTIHNEGSLENFNNTVHSYAKDVLGWTK